MLLPDFTSVKHLDRASLLKAQRLTRDILIASRYARIAKNCPHDGVSETVVLWTATNEPATP